LHEVLAGEVYLPPEYRDLEPQSQPKSVAERFALSKSQERVLELLSEGKSNRDIGTALGITEGTVKIHVTHILKAMKVSNRAQAMLIAQGKGKR
jgi:DNA-binding NarL/FixJ family response regulator